MFKELQANLIAAWGRVRDEVLADPQQRDRRLARRRMPLLTRPPRACCIAVRASDRRIHPASAIIVPVDAAYPDATGRIVDPRPHVVTLHAGLLRGLSGARSVCVWAQPGTHARSLTVAARWG